MMGDPCCELEAMEEELTAEVGIAMMCCELRLVKTWLGRDRRSCAGADVITGSNEGGFVYAWSSPVLVDMVVLMCK
jgi:hypothetical protein